MDEIILSIIIFLIGSLILIAGTISQQIKKIQKRNIELEEKKKLSELRSLSLEIKKIDLEKKKRKLGE